MSSCGVVRRSRNPRSNPGSDAAPAPRCRFQPETQPGRQKRWCLPSGHLPPLRRQDRAVRGLGPAHGRHVGPHRIAEPHLRSDIRSRRHSPSHGDPQRVQPGLRPSRSGAGGSPVPRRSARRRMARPAAIPPPSPPKLHRAHRQPQRPGSRMDDRSCNRLVLRHNSARPLARTHTRARVDEPTVRRPHDRTPQPSTPQTRLSRQRLGRSGARHRRDAQTLMPTSINLGRRPPGRLVDLGGTRRSGGSSAPRSPGPDRAGRRFDRPRPCWRD